MKKEMEVFFIDEKEYKFVNIVSTKRNWLNFYMVSSKPVEIFPR